MMTIQNKSVKIGSKLRKLRMDKGYKQEYLAEVLEVSQKTYSNIENDKSPVSLDALKKIANEYKIDLIELLNNENAAIQPNHSNDSGILQSRLIISQLSEELLSQIKERVADLKQIISERDNRIEILERQVNNAMGS